jgi:hypothetical protein
MRADTPLQKQTRRRCVHDFYPNKCDMLTLYARMTAGTLGADAYKCLD